MVILLDAWVHLLLFWVSHTFLILTPQKVSIHDIVLSNASSWPPVWTVHSSVYNGGLTLGDRYINWKRISAIYQHNNGGKRIDMCLDFRTILYHTENITRTRQIWDRKRERKIWNNFLTICFSVNRTGKHSSIVFLSKEKIIFYGNYTQHNAMHIDVTKLLS